MSHSTTRALMHDLAALHVGHRKKNNLKKITLALMNRKGDSIVYASS